MSDVRSAQKRVEALLQEKFRRLESNLEREKYTLRERYNRDIPQTLQELQSLSGLDFDMLLDIAIQVSRAHENMEWEEVLRIMRTIFQAKRNIEASRMEK